MWILPNITSLLQYLGQLEDNINLFEHIRCCHCGYARVWKHGAYDRKADRWNPSEHSLNPIRIQRFFCPLCKKTCSVLPECIPPRRWYLWEVQQTVLLLLLGGKSRYAIIKDILPSHRTISRWIARFREQFEKHKAALCQCYSDLGRTPHFTDFWRTCLRSLSLAAGMRLCYVAGVSIP